MPSASGTGSRATRPCSLTPGLDRTPIRELIDLAADLAPTWVTFELVAIREKAAINAADGQDLEVTPW